MRQLIWVLDLRICKKSFRYDDGGTYCYTVIYNQIVYTSIYNVKLKAKLSVLLFVEALRISVLHTVTVTHGVCVCFII